MSTKMVRRFVEWNEIGSSPNIVVDAFPNQTTVLTLSHWPSAPNILRLEGDTSSEIVRSFLRARDSEYDAEAVTCSHFDVDSVVSLYLLTRPNTSEDEESLLVEAAICSDFSRYRGDGALKVASVVYNLACAARLPNQNSMFYGIQGNTQQAVVDAVLVEIENVLVGIDAYSDLWVREVAQYHHGKALLKQLPLRTAHNKHLDYSMIELESAAFDYDIQLPYFGLSDLVVHSLTDASTVAVSLPGNFFNIMMRYESWVKLSTRRPYARRDLGVLTEYLMRVDPEAEWSFDGVQQMTPGLRNLRPSRMLPARFHSLVTRCLNDLPVAWNPYDEAPGFLCPVRKDVGRWSDGCC